MAKDITPSIRPFDPDKDIIGAYHCFREGFYHSEWPIIKHAKVDLIMDMVRMLHKMSPQSFVAEIEGEVHGLLLGAPTTRIADFLKCIGFAILHMVPRLLFNRYRMNSLAYKHLLWLVLGWSPLLYLHYLHYLHPFSRHDGEVNMFATRTVYRGRGMGRKLMDTFIKAVKGKRGKGAYVCTDTASSYHFYEAYGFTKKKEFKLRAFRYSLPGKNHKGLIYYLPLKA